MRLRIVFALPIAVISACTAAPEEEAAVSVPLPTSKAAAQSVVEPIVADQLPLAMGLETVPAAVVTALSTCILDTATEAELGTLSVANAGAPSDTIIALISDILNRQETLACAAPALTDLSSSEGA